MPAPAQRPLLFLDVDGPLIPFGAPQAAPAGMTGGRDDALPRAGNTHPLLGRIRSEHGSRLAALPCDLVWASTWMTDANDVIAPLLGLPALAVAEWPDSDEDDSALHWKTRGLVEWAQGRSFVWVDDEITPADRLWVSTHHPGVALLHRVDPRHGLTDHDFAVIRGWLEQVQTGSLFL
ncbi:HAD domain-containing protein [Micromonospora cremea]|uniref:Secreted protein n=1 Tax=Micromonospora cremea TaxID=709881 RepID=A0A1N6AS77_9ACTN|nr:HAD domain-containing protein [Micromonospora cremea]SIN36889.1 hypothetical protein SAMN04489832_6053 [Micromonospora cremea]